MIPLRGEPLHTVVHERECASVLRVSAVSCRVRRAAALHLFYNMILDLIAEML